MAQTRVYKFPSGDLDWIGETSVRLIGRATGLSLILYSSERTISTELRTTDLKRLLLDLAGAIHLHKVELNALHNESSGAATTAGGTPE